MAGVSIDLPPAAAADDAVLVAGLAELVNRVYAVAEEGLWSEDHVRTTTGELADGIRDGEIAVARLDGRVVGSVCIRQLDPRTGGFGMLVAAPEHRGIGVGRELVLFAEALARSRGLSTMQLELLVPRAWTHPGKQFLHDWYTRFGYRIVSTSDFAEAEPVAARHLATPCDYVIYRKDL